MLNLVTYALICFSPEGDTQLSHPSSQRIRENMQDISGSPASLYPAVGVGQDFPDVIAG
jgi:hypothetical protein